jgi:hypothetical protein
MMSSYQDAVSRAFPVTEEEKRIAREGRIARILLPEQPFAWEPKVVGPLQESYSVSFTFSVEECSKPLLLMLFGDPLAVLWWEMSALYRPFWWNHAAVQE